MTSLWEAMESNNNNGRGQDNRRVLTRPRQSALWKGKRTAKVTPLGNTDTPGTLAPHGGGASKLSMLWSETLQLADGDDTNQPKETRKKKNLLESLVRPGNADAAPPTKMSRHWADLFGVDAGHKDVVGILASNEASRELLGVDAGNKNAAAFLASSKAAEGDASWQSRLRQDAAETREESHRDVFAEVIAAHDAKVLNAAKAGEVMQERASVANLQ